MMPRFIDESSPDYPIDEMLLVPNREQYHLLEFGNVIFVPLYQVIDEISSVKPNFVVRNGVKYCYNCGKKVDAKRTNADVKG